jgi:hypothetical protein
MSGPVDAPSTEQVPGPARTRPWVVPAGIVATVVVGWLLTYPLLAGDAFVRQIIGERVGSPGTPFGNDRDGKTVLVLVIFLVVGLPLLLLGLWIGRSVRRRLGLRGPLAVVQALLWTALLLTPFLLVRSDVIDVDTMLGNGWLW